MAGVKRTQYQRNPSGLRTPKFTKNPLTQLDVVSAGTASHPKAFRIGARRPSVVPINVVQAPGASGTY